MTDTVEQLMAWVEEADAIFMQEKTMGMIKIDQRDFLKGLRNFFSDSPSPYRAVRECNHKTETKFLFLYADDAYGKSFPSNREEA